jgi:hypothetical protein
MRQSSPRAAARSGLARAKREERLFSEEWDSVDEAS